MLIRVITTVVVISLAAIVLAPVVYERITGVGVMRISTRNKRARNPQKRRPKAEAYIIGENSESEEVRVVLPIYSFTDIYASMGLGEGEFSQWLNTYGVTLSGKGPDGLLFVPGYPVFSKIAWMGIDVIDLSPAETLMLIDECTTAKTRSVSSEASIELEALIALSRKAVSTGGTVRFGLP